MDFTNSQEVQSIVLVCGNEGDLEICGGTDLTAESGEVGSDFVHISHEVPSGGFRIYRNPTTYNWIFETVSYSGSAGPQIFFYISKEVFDANISSLSR